MRAALILVWTGPWKPWINLYVESCRHNPTYDFLVFTDQPAPAATAPNVRFIPTSLADFERRVRAVLDFPVVLDRGYKLCDYKPVFGLLFADELRPYSHWGYCDEDLIWGQLDHFLTPAVFADHDVVTSCRCCLVGQLTILRNEPRTNTLFQRVPGWRAILREPGTLNLAETILDHQARREEARGELKVWRHQIQIADCGDENWDIWADRLELAEHGRRHSRLPAGPALWREGAVFDASGRNEYAFFHFKTWKKRWPLPPVAPLPAGIAEWRFSAAGVSFVPTPAATPATLTFIHAHARATARLRRRLRFVHARRSLTSFWQRLRRAAARRLPI